MAKIVKGCLVCLFVLALSTVAFAQSTTTGSIGGVVTNPNKEVVPGAAVTAKNVGTNKEDNATTDDTGRFKVANLQPGVYSVTVNSSGFSPSTMESVVVEIGRETSLEVALSVGPVTGTVDVSAEAPVINTTQQDFSTNINQTSINELPVNGRRWSNFANRNNASSRASRSTVSSATAIATFSSRQIVFAAPPRLSRFCATA